jgi:hypothetical protein
MSDFQGVVQAICAGRSPSQSETRIGRSKASNVSCPDPLYSADGIVADDFVARHYIVATFVFSSVSFRWRSNLVKQNGFD